MDAKIITKPLSVALCLCIASCAHLPQQDFKFKLSAASPREARWSQSGLASPGNLAFRFRLLELASNAADAHISFGDFDEQNPVLRVNFSDKRCVGAYEISITYRVNAKEWRSIYPKIRLPWGEDVLFSVQWERDDKAVININNAESQIIDLSDDLKSVRVEVLYGGIDVDQLAYRNSKSSHIK